MLAFARLTGRGKTLEATASTAGDARSTAGKWTVALTTLAASRSQMSYAGSPATRNERLALSSMNKIMDCCELLNDRR